MEGMEGMEGMVEVEAGSMTTTGEGGVSSTALNKIATVQSYSHTGEGDTRCVGKALVGALAELAAWLPWLGRLQPPGRLAAWVAKGGMGGMGGSPTQAALVQYHPPSTPQHRSTKPLQPTLGHYYSDPSGPLASLAL